MKVNKRLFGIPIIAVVTAVIAVVCLGGGFAMSSFLFTQTYTANIKIMADKVGIYEDAACSIASNSNALPFSDIWTGQSSQPVRLYLRNEGESIIYPRLDVSGLPAGLTARENTYGQIASAPGWTDLYTPQSVNWTPGGLATTVAYAEITSTANEIYLASGGMAVNGYVMIDNEVIGYANATVISGRNCIRNLIRGMYGTTPASHSIGAGVSFGVGQEIPLDALEPGEVQMIELIVDASNEAVSGNASFTLTLTATADH